MGVEEEEIDEDVEDDDENVTSPYSEVVRLIRRTSLILISSSLVLF